MMLQLYSIESVYKLQKSQLTRLKNTFEIIESNLWPNTSLSHL